MLDVFAEPRIRHTWHFSVHRPDEFVPPEISRNQDINNQNRSESEESNKKFTEQEKADCRSKFAIK